MSILEEGLSPGEEGAEASRSAASDSLALSIAHDEAKGAPGASRLGKASEELLRKQSHMLDLQMEHLSEQRVAVLKELQLRVMGQRMRVGLQVFTALIVGALALGVVGMVRDAIGSRSVVVEPFDAPPALAARGVSGKVVAGGVLDALTRLQTATRAAAAKRNLRNAWTSDIRIEVPETGVSIGEIDRMLHERLGHDVHVEGDLVQTEAGGLALTVRGDAVAPRTFAGGAGELDKLTSQAAEYIYGQSQPGLYAAYLEGAERYADFDAFAPGAFARASDAERPDIANSWGNVLGSEGKDQEAIAKYRLAAQLQPYYWKAWANLTASEIALGDEEAAFRVGRRLTAAAAAAPAGHKLTPLNRTNIDALEQNWAGYIEDNLYDARINGAGGTQLAGIGPLLAEAAARSHDWAGAERYLTESDAADPYTRNERAQVLGLKAMDDGRFTPDAVAALEAAYVQWQGDLNLQFDFHDHPCYLALAEAMTGQTAKAEAIFSRLGSLTSCASFKADALDHAGDWPGAQAAYAAATSAAPDLPFAYQRWGLALLRRGQPAAAALKFAAASARGPRWADPLKGWGDALAAQGRHGEAIVKYAAAARAAPHWTGLHLAWAQALDRLGRHAEARAQDQAANSGV